MEIAGLGIICYSPFAAGQLRAGQDYLTTSFTRPEDVAAHVLRGDITAFCTGSSGHFELVVSDEPLDSAALQGAAFKVRLCLEVRDSQVCFRDLYDLLRWSPHCPDGQSISLAEGFYFSRSTPRRLPAESSAMASGSMFTLTQSASGPS